MDIARPFRARRNNAGTFLEGFAFALLVRIAENWAAALFTALAAIATALVIDGAVPLYLAPSCTLISAIAFLATVLRTRYEEGKTDWNHAFGVFSAGPIVLILFGILIA